MKEFSKTLFAKTLFYVIHIISLAVFAASVAAEVAMVMLGFYEKTPEAIYWQYYDEIECQGGNFQFAWNVINNASEMRYWNFAIIAVSFILTVTFLVLFLNSIGKKRGSDKLHTVIFDRIPTDLYFLWVVCFFGCLVALVAELGSQIGGYVEYTSTLNAVICVSLIIVGVIYLPFAMRGFAIRIMTGTFFRNTVIFVLIKLLWKPFSLLGEGLRNISIIWRTVVVFISLTAIELFVLLFFFENPKIILIFWIVEKVILLPIAMFIALSLRKLEAAGEKMAEGNLKYRVDLRGVHWMFKKHGANLNSISYGMSRAVEQEIKSDRMKTELITNVSHDIKTPLTSLINYATLISEEPTDNANIKEYSEVLVRQSDRLKRLIEDLVEASKASTGNIDVELVPCDPTVFVTQAAGEYEQKLETSNLSIVTRLPEEEVKIMADGRRMWRIFDNLMNNICKYALPGTRVYLSLDIVDSQAVFTFKNTSSEQLDISEEELMERFVRGDQSRTTEGNGLGLSIAKSMAEVQGGKLNISIDGDLFKATVSFPVITEE